MDFGDYIYIIVALGFSVVSAIGKKRKGKGKPAVPSKARELFDSLFDDPSRVDDPVTQPEYYEDEQGPYESNVMPWEEDVLSPVEEPIDDMQAKLDSLYSRDIQDGFDTAPVVSLPHKTVVQHSIARDLRNHSELQKAIIYAEILKTKF